MKTIKNNIAVLKFVFKFCPQVIIFALLNIIASVVLVISKIYIIAEAIDLVVMGEDINTLFKSLLLYLVMIIITSLFRMFYTYYISTRYRAIYVKQMQQFLFKKVKDFDMELFDNPQFYDYYNRALNDGTWRGFIVFEELVRFLTSFVSTIAVGVIIIVSDPILIAIIAISSIINIFVVSKSNKKWYMWSKDTEQDRRMYNYVNRTFYRQRFAGEIKTTQVGELLISKHQEATKIINNKYKKTYLSAFSLATIQNIGRAIFENGLSYIYLGYRLFNGMKIAVFTATLNATLQFSNNLIDTINFLIRLKENSYYIDDFLWFVNYQPKIEKNCGRNINKIDNIHIDNVSFQYPETEIFSLENIHLNINKGDKIAIVGPNGGGKTTLTKLLLNFYTPKSGEIYADKNAYLDLNIKSLRNRYAVVFQDFQIYAMTIGENILMREVKNKDDEERVWDALEKVGMKDKIIHLEKGIDTQVTREFNRRGAVFSGGETQRLAIARVFASDADIFILDEPTSSLDPLSEERINKLIMNNTDKTMIIIAHRLSTVVDADCIYLIDEGMIKEYGTHKELLLQQGMYEKMFNTQKALYSKS